MKSYHSGIKAILRKEGVELNEDTYHLSTLIRACKRKNDKLYTRLPIQRNLLHMLEDRIEDHFLSINQPYLAKMYKPIISTGYHGLLRAGELMAGPHVMKACNVHTGVNKKKIQIILASSKTHSESMAPQSITIISDEDYNDKYCLYNIINDYISVRRKCILDNEQFFIFRDGSHVRP